MSIQTNSPGIGASDVFTALAHDNCRVILQLLVRSPDDATTVAAVRTAIAEEENGDSMNEQRREQLVQRLHHVDLPRLEDLGLVSYDMNSGDVWLTADRSTVELLDSIDDEVGQTVP